MSNTKIVIDKEDWDKIASEFNSNDLPTATEIQIDQSIEDAAIEFQHSIQNGASQSDIIQMLQDFATSQQIIEQLRVKEKECDLLTRFTEFLMKDGYLNKSSTLSISNYYQRFLECKK